MTDESPIRSIIAVLGGIGLFALVTETLEFTLVTAAAGEYASFTPVWMRVALVLTTGPAMMLGASIRSRVTANH